MKTESKQQTNISEERDTLWIIDQAHTNIRFFAKHLIISKIAGIFKSFEGKVKTVGNDFSTGEIEFKAEVKSLDTGKKERDTHLLSEDSEAPNLFANNWLYPLIAVKGVLNSWAAMEINISRISSALFVSSIN